MCPALTKCLRLLLCQAASASFADVGLCEPHDLQQMLKDGLHIGFVLDLQPWCMSRTFPLDLYCSKAMHNTLHTGANLFPLKLQMYGIPWHTAAFPCPLHMPVAQEHMHCQCKGTVHCRNLSVTCIHQHSQWLPLRHLLLDLQNTRDIREWLQSISATPCENNRLTSYFQIL